MTEHAQLIDNIHYAIKLLQLKPFGESMLVHMFDSDGFQKSMSIKFERGTTVDISALTGDQMVINSGIEDCYVLVTFLPDKKIK